MNKATLTIVERVPLAELLEHQVNIKRFFAQYTELAAMNALGVVRGWGGDSYAFEHKVDGDALVIRSVETIDLEKPGARTRLLAWEGPQRAEYAHDPTASFEIEVERPLSDDERAAAQADLEEVTRKRAARANPLSDLARVLGIPMP